MNTKQDYIAVLDSGLGGLSVLRHLRRARRDPCGGPGVAGTVDGDRRGACAALYARVDHRAAGAADTAAKIIIAKKTVIVYNLSSWRSPVFSEE